MPNSLKLGLQFGSAAASKGVSFLRRNMDGSATVFRLESAWDLLAVRNDDGSITVSHKSPLKSAAPSMKSFVWSINGLDWYTVTKQLPYTMTDLLPVSPDSIKNHEVKFMALGPPAILLPSNIIDIEFSRSTINYEYITYNNLPVYDNGKIVVHTKRIEDSGISRTMYENDYVTYNKNPVYDNRISIYYNDIQPPEGYETVFYNKDILTYKGYIAFSKNEMLFFTKDKKIYQ